MHDWRIIGRWRDGRMFLVTFGESLDDVRARLRKALSGYSRDQLDRIDEVWSEYWSGHSWYVCGSVSIRGIKLSRTMTGKKR